MAQAALSPRFIDVETYLAEELASDIRHEYVAGQVYAMTGASVAHNLIGLNLATLLRMHLRGGPCRVFMSDLKLRLRLGADDIFYYPDLMVACQADDRAEYWREQPCLVVEIASPSTARIDRREKLWACRQIATLEDYLLVEQDRRALTLFSRGAGWRPQTLDEADTLHLASVGLDIAVADIYEGVDVSE